MTDLEYQIGGLTNFNWTGWSFPEGIEEYWKPWVAAMNVTRLN